MIGRLVGRVERRRGIGSGVCVVCEVGFGTGSGGKRDECAGVVELGGFGDVESGDETEVEEEGGVEFGKVGLCSGEIFGAGL